MTPLRFPAALRWPLALAVTVLPALFYALSWGPSSEPIAFGTTILGPARVGRWVAVLGGPADAPLAPGTVTRWNARLCEDCYDEVLRGWIAYGDAAAPGAREELTGVPNSFGASLTTPSQLPGEGLYIWLGLEDWTGRTQAVRWKLGP